MLTYLWIAIGGALGSMARYACSVAAVRAFGEAFPWGTLAVNVAGSFAIGLFASLDPPGGRWPMPADARLFLTVGLCGGFTTFSSFSAQTLGLLEQGRVAAAFGNVAGSVGLCLLAVWAGYALGAAINGGKAA